MAQKLTILVEEDLVRFAKEFAKNNNTSVSKLLNNFLFDLQNAKKKRKIIYDPYVKKFSGIFNTGSKDIMKEVFGK